jgi:3-phenylpropionate/trans-cinnamate dioxygenase ferredoxin reductase subunit
MASKDTIVIVGAGLAGAKAAETLRSEGFNGRVVLVGDEGIRPYERPPLSKQYLRREKDFDFAAVHDEEYYGAHDIELLADSRAVELDLDTATVALSSGQSIHYDRLLLATGAEPRRLSVPGADLAGVHYLRRVTDADELYQALAPSPRVVVIGAGWIGAEVAASARQLGAEVAMIEMGHVPLERVLGAEVGGIYRDLHAEHGVKLHFGVAIDSILGDSAVGSVRLSDGTELAADLVVVGIGATPRLELAEGTGLAIENGLLVDEHLATNVPNVFAAGDVANAFNPLYGEHIRLEHWAAALHQGPVAAVNMLGASVSYDRVPYFYSDQYDVGMEYRGWAQHWDEVVFRGDPSGREFLAFWLLDGCVVAAMNANVWDSGDALDALVRARAKADVSRLSDSGIPLAEVTSAS